MLVNQFILFSFYLGFLSRAFTIHKAAREGAGVSLKLLSTTSTRFRHLDISRTITAESSPLHIASSRTRTGKLWFPSASRYEDFQPGNSLKYETVLRLLPCFLKRKLWKLPNGVWLTGQSYLTTRGRHQK